MTFLYTFNVFVTLWEGISNVASIELGMGSAGREGTNSCEHTRRGIVIHTARILIVDDDPLLQKGLSVFLMMSGFEVKGAMTARQALELLDGYRPELIVLDLGLPDRTGNDLCVHIRKTSGVPIIVLSGRGGDEDKITALGQGADDYLTKPFSSEELLARIRVALRRIGGASDTGRLDRGSLIIDFDRRRVVVGEHEVRLTPKEFELLAFLARRPNRVIPHRAILMAIWGEHAVDRPEQLWALVMKVRRKIEPDPESPRYLMSEPWVGYRFATESDVKDPPLQMSGT
jgi:two-component system KDP operon response regulator KdpE